MAGLEKIISRVIDVEQKIKELFSEEKELEEQESAELQKIKKLRKHIKASKGDSVSEDVKRDFVDAIKLFERISAELYQTSKELNSIVEEISKNSGDELETVEGLASNIIMLREISKIEDFAESITKTKTNTEKVSKELEQLKNEVKEAQKEAEELIKMDKFLKNIESLDKPEDNLRSSIKRLENAEDLLPDISAKLSEIKERESQTFGEIAENTGVSRRTLMKGAGGLSASALLGLSGCISEEAKKMWGLEEVGSESEVERMYNIENEGSESGMNPLIDSRKADNISLAGVAAEVEEFYNDADKMTRKALGIHNNHSTENLPEGKEIEEMMKLFKNAVKLYQRAESILEKEGLKTAEEMINQLEDVNQTYYNGVDHLHMSWRSMQEGHQEDAEEHLKKYQQSFLDAIEMKKVSEYELKKALQQA